MLERVLRQALPDGRVGAQAVIEQHERTDIAHARDAWLGLYEERVMAQQLRANELHELSVAQAQLLETGEDARLVLSVRG